MGGWTSYSHETSRTVITTAVVVEILELLEHFRTDFNDWCKDDINHALVIGPLAGSTSYYLRDKWQDPFREYGDVDVNIGINGYWGGAPSSYVFNKCRQDIIAFCAMPDGNYRTENGINIIFKTSAGAVQVDFMLCYTELLGWTRMLAPEYRIKGVVSASIMSSFAKAINVSFGPHGIQVKHRDGVVVPFSQRKGITIDLITDNPDTWSSDVYNYFYTRNTGEAPVAQWPAIRRGLNGHQRCYDLVWCIGTIARNFSGANGGENLYGYDNLERYENAHDLIQTVKTIFTSKMDDAILSPKFDKAESPKQIETALKTKRNLKKWKETINNGFDMVS